MRRVLLVTVFITLASCVMFGLHYYLVQRLVIDVGLGSPWREIAIAAVAVFGATLVLQPLGERTLGPPHSRIISWPASLWMGFAFLTVVLLALSDLLFWLGGRSALAASVGSEAAAAPALRALGVVTIALGVGLFALRDGLRMPKPRRVEIPLARWPRALDGFRIVQISDLHVGPILGRAFAEHVTREVNRLDPDLVAVTGDLVDGAVSKLADEVAPFASLHARHGVYFVTGNHDHYSGADAWVDAVQKLGMHVLRNEHVSIEADGAGFDLVGVDDAHGSVIGGSGGEDLERAFAGRDRSRPSVLLAHDPATFRRSPAHDVDLQLSGHTHGGQIWPFSMLVRLAVPYVAGSYAVRNSRLYVSRGTGFWGPPMRFLAPAEISEIVLRSA